MDSNANLTQVDVAIVGGAMVGATTALGLAQQAKRCGKPLKIALIEAHQSGQQDSGFDARAIAVADGSIFALSQLGIWQSLAKLGTPIRDIHVSDRGHFGMTEINAQRFGLDALGQVIELSRAGQVLEALLTKSGIEYYCPATLASIHSEQQHHTLTLDNGQQLQCKLLIAADGLNSKVRELQQLPLEVSEFGQSAIIANISVSQPHHNMAWERFTENGPIALLPMADSDGKPRLSLVWAMATPLLERHLAMSDSEFLSALQQAFGNRAGNFLKLGERHCYPLALSLMPRPAYHRTVYLGNAAQTLHPIAGQGFNLGMRDVMALVDAVGDGLAQDQDLGGVQLIHHYLQSREQDRRETIASIELLVRGFSNQYWPLVAGRNLGLRMLSWLPPLKTPVARRAMGWQGRQQSRSQARS
ncbi:2-octaprenyl-6-methoxyphenyl hydroxylase [Shewanella avicenniae]|uniref:2-octaprenyl-6-methoxyphenyl hydroxylase n=1 Tax=Shewanella avicenniae TaxID=2814294 RepID=A0ABX7QTY2_9GAMM|nr:2-octaprenyl-6-methoxyphenyl hydroxylase [Shewanella avicenniae]QSX34450.1 2-octaprenyl-6-methoxyphenyl hydroxylase [Shewanella avicenniae]